jgi:hypothetical protein
MKLPGWLIASMLTSCTLVTSAGAALWVTGPERTARNFGRLFALHQFEEASLLLATQAQMHDIESEVEGLFQQQETPPQFDLRVARRSISDTMCGKLQFVISVEIHEYGQIQLHFQVCNGMVRFVKEEYRTPDGRVVFVDAREHEPIVARC